MDFSTWRPVSKNYDEEYMSARLQRDPVIDHPFNRGVVPLLNDNIPLTLDKRSSLHDGRRNIMDPLSETMPPRPPITSQSSTIAGVTNSTNLINKDQNKLKPVDKDSSLELQWTARKEMILQEYATEGNTTIGSRTSIESSDNEEKDIDGTASSKRVHLYTKRLANLERRHNIVEQKVSLTQSEYIAHIDRLTNELQTVWKQDERVQSLKIAIQLSKLLSDTTMPKFYPYTFVLITNALDLFGRMVYSRLHSIADDAIYDLNYKSHGYRIRLSDQFSYTDIPDIAQETCCNWIYKILCIRELQPRIFIEISLLKCHRFICNEQEYCPLIARIGATIRGMGDSLIATYARSYLITCANNLFPNINSNFNMQNELQVQLQECYFNLVHDSLYTMRMFSEPLHQRLLERHKMTQGDFLHILSPAISWICSNAARNANKRHFQRLLVIYRDLCPNSIVLYHILDSFDVSIYLESILGVVALIQSTHVEVEHSEVQLCDLIACKLSTCPSNTPVLTEHRSVLLNDIWRCLSKSDDVNGFVKATISWLKLLLQLQVENNTEKEMMLLLRELSTRYMEHARTGHVISDKTLDELEKFISFLVTTVLNVKGKDQQADTTDVGSDDIPRRNTSTSTSTTSSTVLNKKHNLLSPDIIAPLLEMFPGTRKVNMCKIILLSVRAMPKTNDPVLLHTLLEVSRHIHDSIDILSPKDHIQDAIILIKDYIYKIDFGRDFEQQLSLYVECRAMFPKLHHILEYLIFSVNNLAMCTCKIMKRGHTKKTAAFVKACMAYCHITIPSIPNVFNRLQLNISCAETAINNNCLPQTDTFLKAAISIITEIPDEISTKDTSDDRRKVHNEELLSRFIRSMLALLVIVPGHPDIGPFYILQGLLGALSRFSWQRSSVFVRTTLDFAVVILDNFILQEISTVKFLTSLITLASKKLNSNSNDDKKYFRNVVKYISKKLKTANSPVRAHDQDTISGSSSSSSDLNVAVDGLCAKLEIEAQNISISLSEYSKTAVCFRLKKWYVVSSGYFYSYCCSVLTVFPCWVETFNSKIFLIFMMVARVLSSKFNKKLQGADPSSPRCQILQLFSSDSVGLSDDSLQPPKHRRI
eukprot:gene1750-3381_t